MVDLFAVFWGNSIWFSIVDVPTYIPTNSAQGCPFLHLLTNAVISCPLDDSHSSKCGVISHCMVFICISLTISGGEHHLMFPLDRCVHLLGRNVSFSLRLPLTLLRAVICIKTRVPPFPNGNSWHSVPPTISGKLSGLTATSAVDRWGKRNTKRGGNLVTWPAVSETRIQPRQPGSGEHSFNHPPFLPLHSWESSLLEAETVPEILCRSPQQPRKHSIWRKESQWEIQGCLSNQKYAVN